MSDQESNRNRRIVGWGIIGLIAVIGVSIAYRFSILHLEDRGLSYPFFPFHFGWVGVIFDIHRLLDSKMVFLALERRREVPASAPAKTGRRHQLSKRDMQKAK